MHDLVRRKLGTVRAVRAGMLEFALAAMAAIAGLLILFPPTVQAAPSLTASPNPVLIPSGQSTGSTTLSWNAGDASAVEIRVSVNGGADQLVAAGLGVSGSRSATVTFGNTYVYKLYRSSAVRPQLITSTTVTTARPSGGAGLPGTVGTAPNGTIGRLSPPPVIANPSPSGTGLPGNVGTQPGGGLGRVSPPPVQQLPASSPPVFNSPPNPSTPPSPSPTGCALQCIKSVVVESWAEQTHIRVETDTPASIFFESWFLKEHIGPDSYWPPHPTKLHSSGKVQVFDEVVDMGGKAGVVYGWRVTATDAQGKSAKQEGTLTVLRRVVWVHFNEVYVSNDSDPNGSGECLFHFHVNDDTFSTHYANNECSDDRAYPINMATSIWDAPAELELYVRGGDDDEESIFWVDLDGKPFNEWGETRRTFKVSGEPKHRDFTLMMYDPVEGDFAFEVSGYFSWAYLD